jgi:hypothetical protein
MARNYVSTIKKDFDYSKINNHLLAMTQLSYVFNEIMSELKEYLDDKSMYVQDVKYNIQQIERKLKTYPKVDFDKLEKQQQYDYCDDYDEVEKIIFSLFNIRDDFKYAFFAKHEIGNKMWTEYNGKQRLVLVCKIDFNVDYQDGEIAYNKNYQCMLLNSKTNKPTSDKLVSIKEKDLYKHKKEMSNV